MRINAEYLVKFVVNGKVSQISLWYSYKRENFWEKYSVMWKHLNMQITC